LRVFIAGIIQGSINERSIHGQDYREAIREALARWHPDWEVYCPFAEHPESLGYDDRRASEVFFRHVCQAAEADLLIAYLPEASMGTAIEMFEAVRRGRTRVVAISPMTHNWAVRFCSHALFPDLGAFLAGVEAGDLAAIARAVEGDG
jgi:hypothetical protein